MTETKSGLVYDVAAVDRILGTPPMVFTCNDPVPHAADGEIVIYYGGWSLEELRDSRVGNRLMHQGSRYYKYAWSNEKLPPGMYLLRIPVPGSSSKSYTKQEEMIPGGESVAPVVLVATALLVHRSETGQDLLKDDSTRCRERADHGYHVVLSWRYGRLCIPCIWHDTCGDNVWVSSVRK